MKNINFLNKKRVILGITGGIAAYKSAYLLRLLKQQGSEVRVVMTTAAQGFVSAMTFQALSHERVYTSIADAELDGAMGHIELARWADCIVIAPASANFCAKIAHGAAEDLLSTLCLATTAPILIAPAMNEKMWANPATQTNLQHLTARNMQQIGPLIGEQACGDVGPGRMAEPEAILEAIIHLFNAQPLSGQRVLITAGPTQEAIDPVRYISNYSSGKMGYALALAAVEAGATVSLISGPTALQPPERAQFIKVSSAEQMHAAVMQQLADCDIFIGTAAVADYRCAHIEAHKIKKTAETLTLTLERTEDILNAVAHSPARPGLVIGFAAETENVLANAQAKLQRKKVDYMIANDVTHDKPGGFAADDIAITILGRGQQIAYPLAAKNQVARQLIQFIGQRL